MAHSRTITSMSVLRRGGSALLCLVAALVACKPPESTPVGSIERIGVVLLSEAPSGAVFGQATFTRLGSARPEALLAAPFGAQVGACRVTSAGGSAADPVIPGTNGNRLNAGNVTLRAGGAEYASMTRTDPGSYAFAGAAEPLPARLSIDLGATGAFPGFPNLGVAAGAAPELAGEVDLTAITADATFSWQPGEAGAAAILIGSDGGVSFRCLADDAAGTFTFPDATRLELEDAGFTTGTLTVFGRMTTTQATSGSALLMINILRLANLGNE